MSDLPWGAGHKCDEECGCYEGQLMAIRKSLSDSQAREAMKDEALNRIIYEPELQHADKTCIARAALSSSSDSWLKREKARVWREAAKIESHRLKGPAIGSPERNSAYASAVDVYRSLLSARAAIQKAEGSGTRKGEGR